MISSGRSCRPAGLSPSTARLEEKPLLEIHPMQDGGEARIIADGIEAWMGLDGHHELVSMIQCDFESHESVIHPSQVEVRDGQRRGDRGFLRACQRTRQAQGEANQQRAPETAHCASRGGAASRRPMPGQSPSPIRLRSAWKRGCSLIAWGNSGPLRNALTCGSRALTASSAQSSASSTLPRTWRSTETAIRRF
jgi:hypothetical protein